MPTTRQRNHRSGPRSITMSKSPEHETVALLPLDDAQKPLLVKSALRRGSSDEDTSSTTRCITDTRGLLRLEQLPAWQADNEYILTGYRPESNSLRLSCQSIFAIHNETVNIHSHLFGTLLFLYLPVFTWYRLFSHYPSTQWQDIIVFNLYYFGVAVCFLLSTILHTLLNHSLQLSLWINQIDYMAIVLLMWGATIPTVYYGFYYHPALRIVYWTLVSILAVLCIVATVQPTFHQPAMRPYRAGVYASLGLSAIIFIVHGIAIMGFETANQRLQLKWMAIMATCNFIGALTYATRVPEKRYPERFDICGSGHQIMHFMVILAGIAHTIGLFEAFAMVHA